MKDYFYTTLILLGMFTLFAVSSCSKANKPKPTVIDSDIRRDVVYSIQNGPTKLQVVVIDSCEYLFYRDYGQSSSAGFLAHKGNCKYCAERRRKELEKLLKENNTIVVKQQVQNTSSYDYEY
jgi:hypothetical protein